LPVGDGGAPVGDGGAETTTAELHEAVRSRESVTVQVNGVLPIGNIVPDAGEQLAVTGAAPPVTVGLKFTATGLPSDDEPVATGQMIDGRGATPVAVTPDASVDGSLSAPVELYARTTK
jgi:hypothetical protein